MTIKEVHKIYTLPLRVFCKNGCKCEELKDYSLFSDAKKYYVLDKEIIVYI